MCNNSQCCWHVRTEFQRRHVGFGGVHQARFIFFQWRTPMFVILLYRLILAAYCVFWLMYDTTQMSSADLNGISYYAFLTNWTYFMLTLYLVVHLLAVIIYTLKTGRSPFRIMSPEQHRCLFHELGIEPSLWSSSEYQIVVNNESDDEGSSVVIHTSMPFIYKLVWLLYNIVASTCLMVTVMFWSMLYSQMAPMSGKEFMINFQFHGVTSIIIVVEHLLTAIPCRLLHFLFPLAYGLIYVVFSGIYYAVDHSHILYPNVLDWSQPGRSVVVIVLTVFVVFPLVQVVLFVVYKLKIYLYNKINPEPE